MTKSRASRAKKVSKKRKKVRKRVPHPKRKKMVGKGKKTTGQKLMTVATSRNIVIAVASFLGLIFLSSVQGLFAVKGLSFYIITLVIAIALLITASERFLNDAKCLARKAGIAEIIIGLTIVSIGTSIPEIASTSMASYQAKVTGNPGLSDFALGNIYGSVLVQITFVLGLVVLVRPMLISRGSVKRDGIAMIAGIGLLSFFTMRDLRLDQLESIALVIIYAMFIYYLVRNRHKIKFEEEKDEAEVDDDCIEESDEVLMPTYVHCIMLVIGLALVVYSSDWMVLSAVKVAESVGVPEGVIGVTISAVGTSLPELAIALVAVKKARGVAIGTLIGSNVTDPMLSVGIAGLINPISISPATSSLFVTIIAPFTIISCILGVVFMWSSLRIERWEGAVLVGAYLVFVPLIIYFM